MNTKTTDMAKRQPEPEVTEVQDQSTRLIELAINRNVPVETLERLMAMNERIMDRNAKVAYTTAFAEMQAQLPVITEKGKIIVNNQVRSEYARFEDINEVCKPILQQHGFAISFRTKTGPDGITVTGVLSHKEGHQEETDMTLKADTSGAKNDVQSIGSSVSYAKRYVMQALLNITSRGEDDDGNAGGGLSDEQATELHAMFTDAGATSEKADEMLALLAKTYRKSRIQDIPAGKFEEAKAKVRDKIAKRKVQK